MTSASKAFAVSALSVIAAAMACGVPRFARADPLNGPPPLHETIEWKVANADAIVRGRVVEQVRIDDPTDDSWDLWLKVKVAVSESLLGDNGKEITFLIDEDTYRFFANEVDLAANDLVFFLFRHDRYSPRTWDDPCLGPEAPPRPPKDLGLLISEWPVALDGKRVEWTKAEQELSKVSEILGAMRREVRRRGDKHPPSVDLFAMRKSASRTDQRRAQFVLPVDEHLLKQVPAWAISDDPVFRANAARLIRHDPTPANLDRLRKLLDDPFIQESQRTGRKLYFVRAVAYEACSDLEMDVPEPTIDATAGKP
jgi:hypothetical protein